MISVTQSQANHFNWSGNALGQRTRLVNGNDFSPSLIWTNLFSWIWERSSNPFIHIWSKSVKPLINKATGDDQEALSYTNSLFVDGKILPANCQDWNVSFVHIEGRAVAHLLAKFAGIVDDFVAWMEEASDFLLPLLHSDVSLLYWLIFLITSFQKIKK